MLFMVVVLLVGTLALGFVAGVEAGKKDERETLAVRFNALAERESRLELAEAEFARQLDWERRIARY